MPTKPTGDPLKTSPRNAQSFPSEAAVVLCPAALARFRSIWVDLFPRSPPPHTRRCSSYLSELPPPTLSEPNNHTNNDKNSQVSLGSTNKRSKLPLILTFHFLKSDNSGCLLVYNSSEASFTLHNDVGNDHLAAQGGEEDDELDGVNVVRDDDEGGFLGFNEGDDVVEAVFDKEGFLGVLFITMSEVKVANKTTKEGTLASFSFSSATEAAAAVKRAFFS